MEEIVFEDDWKDNKNGNCNYKPSKLARYSFSGGTSSFWVNKQTTPLQIIDNVKSDKPIYKDLHLEVYVKEEAIVKDFITCFDFEEFQKYAIVSSNFFEYRSFVNLNFSTTIGIPVETYDPLNVCRIDHEVLFKKGDNNFFGNLIFKNLFFSDVSSHTRGSSNNAKPFQSRYINTILFAFYFRKIFSLMYRKNYSYSLLKFNNFFDFGYLEDYEIEFNSLLNDEILGINLQNNYLTINQNHTLSGYLSDTTDAFYPSYYGLGIKDFPFFKEKIFEDANLKLTLKKEDVLGNILKRVVRLPIKITFYNNLIRCFQYHYTSQGPDYVMREFVNSENLLEVEQSAGPSFGFAIPVWCPDVTKLHLCATIYNNKDKFSTFPALSSSNTSFEDSLNGQVAYIWTDLVSSGANINYYMNFVLEYNDGINYDKFTLQIKMKGI